MAEVYLATAKGIEDFERHVVIKRIHAEQARNTSFVQMFLDEARLAASLHHHNIVQVHDIGQDNDEYFYAMEYVHGEDLRALLAKLAKKKLQVPLDHVVTILSAAAAGLHYAHEHRGRDGKPLGLVHRDVSPSNILVDYEGNVKVVDFGIAKATQHGGETRSGVLKGKVSYMSPEQCRGKALDRRSDVYALGIVLYELATVRRLFKGDSDFMTMSGIVAGKIPPPSSRRPDLPAELEAIIMKALARDPAERFQSAAAMREALEAFASTANLRTSTAALAGFMKQVFGHRREPWLVPDGGPLVEEPDFDGSASGIAEVSLSDVESFEISSEPTNAPIVVARKKADSVSPTAAGITPMAWSPSEKPRKQSRAWLAAILLVVAAGGAFAVTQPWNGDDDEPTSAKAPRGDSHVSVPPAPPPSEPPPSTQPPSTQPPSIEAPPPTQPPSTGTPVPDASQTEVAAGSAEPPPATTTAKATKPIKKVPPKRPARPKTSKGSAVDATWDPDTLLPD